MKLRSTPEIIRAAQLAINNTRKDATVAKKMAQFGFPERRLQQGIDLLATVQDTQRVQKTCYDENWQLSHRIEQELQALRPLFMDHVTAVRFVFRRQPAILHTFKVKSISLSKWAWVEQAQEFYEAVPPHYEVLAAVGVSREELDQAQASVAAVLALRDDRLHKKGEAEDSTEARNQARRLLQEWIRDFRATARLALKDTPQKLEAFGIRVPSLQK